MTAIIEEKADLFRQTLEWVIGRPLSNTETLVLAQNIDTTYELLLEQLELIGVEVRNGKDKFYVSSEKGEAEGSSICLAICNYFQQTEGRLNHARQGG